MSTKRQRIEEEINKLYKFRYNVLTGSVYYRRVNETEFKEHTTYAMYSIIRELDAKGSEVSEKMFHSIIMSDFTELYHPIKYYFLQHLKKLPPATGTPEMEKLAATVTVPNPDVFFLCLKKWLVASVANGLTEKDCQNHTCLVFTGGMGLFKTTWLMNLCPPMLNPEMAFTGKIDLNLANKDTFTMLGTKFIMNLDDQLRNLMKKDSETMKTLVTHPEVSIRRPFAKFAETIPRIANFLASINGEEFLAENENRRFLPFRVSAIDIKAAKAIDMDLVWNEALTLFRTTYIYWWTAEQLEEAFPDMGSFAYVSDELEIITSFFEIPTKKEFANVVMNATQIQSFFKSKCGLQLSTKKIGEALKTLGAIIISVRENGVPVKKYALIERGEFTPKDNITSPFLIQDITSPFLIPKM